VLLRAGQSPFEPRLITESDGPQTDREPHPDGGQPLEEPPAGHLDRVWPDTDPVGNRLAAAKARRVWSCWTWPTSWLFGSPQRTARPPVSIS